jgi:Domain of unknown function (DUF5615)
MRFLIDENMSDRRLESRLQARGHAPILAHDVGLLSTADARMLIWAIGHALPVLTRDSSEARSRATIRLVFVPWAMRNRRSW